MKIHALMLVYICLSVSTAYSQQTQFATSFDGIDIAYQEYGDGDIPLVFVHGWCCDKSYWKEQIEFFESEFRVVALDLVGHGESGLGRENYTMKNFAKDVTAVIDLLNLEEFILIGHSMGVTVILETAILNLDNTIAIFPIDGITRIPDIKSKEELIKQEKEDRSQWAVDRFQQDTYNWIKTWYHPKSDSILLDQIAKDISTNNPEVGVEALVNLFQYWNGILPEALKLVGDLPIINFAKEKANEDEFREYGLNYKHIRMEGLSHFFMMSHPDEFNELLNTEIKTLLHQE
jgi:pimeloyl-ACP methyl ester carboxylesterase